MKNVLIILVAIIPSLNMAQKLSDFKWEKRLLIISNPSNNSEKEVEQLQYLGPIYQDFTELKLLVLKINYKT